MTPEAIITVRDLKLAYGSFVVLQDINFSVHRGEVKVIMGGSGCGKSTLMRHLAGLQSAHSGRITIAGQEVDPESASIESIRRRFGILFQSGALWSSMTLAENVALPLEQHTGLEQREIAEMVDYKLSLVGLRGLGSRYPAELSGGMRKRAGLARAMALDPDILFFDEPSAGLDPLSARKLDDLILHLRDALGTTIVAVTHELDSIFAIADSALFLDSGSRTALAEGAPQKLRDDPNSPEAVRLFLRRGKNATELSKLNDMESHR